MESGIVLVDKPKGITTYDVIRKLKGRYPKGTKIGHTGTLDPFATGLVIILIGKENKKQAEYHNLKKEYLVTAHFNIETDTGDLTGKVLEKDSTVLSEEEIKREIEKSFIGKILQSPPTFSAKHINGVRAYELARKGVEVNLKPSEIEVYSFEVLKYDWPNVRFKISCGSGTYIRSLISDLAKSLGTFAYCEELRRVSMGDYNVKDALIIK